jgi:hypothetical protein
VNLIRYASKALHHNAGLSGSTKISVHSLLNPYNGHFPHISAVFSGVALGELRLFPLDYPSSDYTCIYPVPFHCALLWEPHPHHNKRLIPGKWMLVDCFVSRCWQMLLLGCCWRSECMMIRSSGANLAAFFDVLGKRARKNVMYGAE